MSIKFNKNLRINTLGNKVRSMRTAAAFLIIVFSVSMGFFLINASDKSVPFWGLTRDLGVGSVIHDGDLVIRQAHLDRAAAIYLSGRYKPIGLYVTRDLQSGELLPASAVAKGAGLPTRRVVTVEVDDHHFPPGIARGDLVDLYVTVRGQGGEILGAPEQVIADVVIDSVDLDRQSTHFGVALSLFDIDVPKVVEAAQRGHLDLVGRR